MNMRRYWHEKSTIHEIIKTLLDGCVVAGISDTVIGLIAPLTEHGLNALNRIKGRADKPYIVLVGSIEQANQFTDALQYEPLNTLVSHSWPGPLTLIVPAKQSTPSVATSSAHTIALRVPAHTGLQQIAQTMGGIFSTSANKANQPIPHSIDELDQTIKESVALVVDDQEDTKKTPSTILDCTGDSIKLIREGEYGREYLQNYVPNISIVKQP